MKISTSILLAGCLWSIPVLHAQEIHPRPFAGADSAAVVLLPAVTLPVSVEWLQEEVDPILRERRRLYELQERISEHSVLAKPAPSRQFEGAKATGLWRMKIGNTGIENWSPHPDRMLDARVISFPMRRDARADKRSDQQKALDKIRSRK